MIDWIYIAVGSSLLLLVFLFWIEITRKNKARLTWRLTATAFAIISFACLALDITYTSTSKQATSNEAIILTEGFNKDSLSIFDTTNTPILTLEQSTSTTTYHATHLSDISLLSYKYPSIAAFHVFGNGLRDEELTSLNNKPIIFHPSKPLSGISSINWQTKIKAGEKLYLQGRVNNTSSAQLKIVLSSFNTTLDSLTTTSNNSTFELTTIPKHSGRNVYQLSVLDADNDTIEKQPVPVEVVLSEPSRILMLASSPDFENKFLKNWLAEKGYNVAIRTTISKNKYDKEFLNTPSLALDRITSFLLSNFDIILTDASQLSSISTTELAAIKSAVGSGTMGLIIRADSAASNSFSRLFPVSYINGANATLHLHLPDTTIKLPALNIDAPAFIRSTPATQPLVFDKQNRVFVNSALHGAGKIVFTTLTNTFSWSLSGNNAAYAELWSELLNKAAGKPTAEETWSVSPQLPRIDYAAQIQLQTNTTTIPQANIAGSAVYLKQDATLPYHWTGTYWPVKAGWQPTIQLNGETFWWYAYAKNDWKNVEATEKISATQNYAAEHPYFPGNNVTNTTTNQEFPKIYFLLVFVICSGFLWLERKLLN